MTSWRDIETAPKGTPVIVAARCSNAETWLVGEAYYRNEGDDDDGWWWADEGPGDYHAASLQSRGTPPLWWQPMPTPPQG